MKILGFGNALVDILIRLDNDNILDTLNLPKGSMQLIGSTDIPKMTKFTDNNESVKVSGGSAANTIHGLACLGASCGYIGKVGNDELGQFYANDLKAIHVASKLYQSTTETGRAFTLISPDSERTFATYLGAAIELQASDIEVSFLREFNLLHIEGYLVQNKALIEYALKLAKSHGLKISVDLASYNVVDANRDFLKKIIPKYVDIVFANEEEAKAYTGEKPEDALRTIASQCKIAIVKIGKKGSLIQSGKEVRHISIEPIKSIDTTGAGDQYAAGFLFGYSNNLSLIQSGRLGSLLAGAVVQHIGARIPKELWPEIKNNAAEIIRSI